MVVPFSQAWPFDPEPGKLPSGYRGPGFFGQWPLAQDPIAWAMAVPCDMDCEQLHGPSPIFGDTLGRQLDALACDYVFTYPAQHPERIVWVESARFIDAPAVTTWPGAGAGTLESTFEVARLPSPSAGALQIEDIETYLRITAGAGEGAVILISGTRSDFLGVPGASISEPFPFPLSGGGLPGTVEVKWQLVHQWRDEVTGRVAPWSNNLTEAQAVPATFQPRPPWRDNRYGWGSRHASHKQYVVGGTGLVRLFCTLRVSSQANWSQTVFRVAGGLRGFWQNAGRDAAAVKNTILRQ